MTRGWGIGVAAVVSAALLIPFAHLPVGQGLLPSVVARAPTLALLAVAGMILILGRVDGRAVLAADGVVGLLALYWGVALVVAIGLDDRTGSGGRVLYYGAGCMPYLAVRIAARGSHAAGIPGRVLGAVGILLGTLACFEYLSDWNPWKDLVFNHSNSAYLRLVQHDVFSGRVLGPMGHPVVLGCVLALLFPLSVWRVGETRGFARGAWIFGTAAIIGGTFVTFSRGAWLALIAGAVAFAAGHRHQRKALVVCLAAAIVVVVAVGLAAPQTAEVLKSRDPVREYLHNFGQHGRFQAYSQVARLVAMEPLVGHGVGQYRVAAVPKPHTLQTPDNMYLVWLAEAGVVGLTLNCAILWTLIYTLGREGQSGLAHAVRAGLIGFAVNMVIADLLYLPGVRLLFWCYAGIGISAVAQVTQGQEDDD